MQQPPNQYPHYPPQWQQPPVTAPQPSKKPRFLKYVVIGCGAFAILIVLVIALAVAVGAGKSSTSTGATTGQSSQSSSSGQPTPKVGVPFVVNETWTVTVNSIKTSQGGVLDAPKPGNTLLVVNVTLKNTSSAVQHASGLIQFSLKDSTGQTYNEDIAYGTDPGGTVAPGGLTRGELAYEVPKSVHSFTLQFVSSIGSSDLTEWNISI